LLKYRYMKIISLNIWCGQIYEPLIELVKKHAGKIDVFCFQEVMTTKSDVIWSNKCRMNIFEEFSRALPNHNGYFSVTQDKVDLQGQVDFDSSFGLAMFSKKDLKVDKQGDVFVYRHKNACVFEGEVQGAVTMGRNMQYVEIDINNKKYTICNLHGLWNGKGKTDSDDRISQSVNVKKFLDKIQGEKILCGDFNLAPDTESLKIIKEGMIDLIEVYKIESTRSHLYRRYGKPGESFADYIILSPDIKVNDFKVLSDVAADHLPLYLDIL